MTKEKYLSDEIEHMEENKYSFNTNQNNDLFDDEANVVHKIVSVRRVKLPRNGENWEVLEDNRVALTLKGVRLTKREKSILYTPEGINLLMSEYKSGNKSVTKIKKLLREAWKRKNDNL